MEAVSALPVRPFNPIDGDDVPPDRRRDVRVSQASVIAIRWITVGWVSSKTYDHSGGFGWTRSIRVKLRNASRPAPGSRVARRAIQSASDS
jgi:hypothetical protein